MEILFYQLLVYYLYGTFVSNIISNFAVGSHKELAPIAKLNLVISLTLMSWLAVFTFILGGAWGLLGRLLRREGSNGSD